VSNIYSLAPDEAVERVAHLVKCFHQPLLEAGVKIDVLTVADEEGESCLKLHGNPAYAVAKIVSSKDRVKGAGDCEIVIDEPSYTTLSDASKDALLDHEIHHFELKIKAKTGRVKLDENGRPKLGIRKHDHDFGWFTLIAKRHGAASIECRQATDLLRGGRQTYFAFALDGDAQPALEAGAPDTIRFSPAALASLKADK